jgi:dihydroxyacetone kinase-like predicted kinase
MTQNLTNQNQVALEKSVDLNGQQVKSMIEAGMLWLRTNHQIVNALNVFPVPDGDTGSNMLLTMQAGWQEIAKTSEDHVGNMLSLMARGVLMGAGD